MIKPVENTVTKSVYQTAKHAEAERLTVVMGGTVVIEIDSCHQTLKVVGSAKFRGQ